MRTKRGCFKSNAGALIRGKSVAWGVGRHGFGGERRGLCISSGKLQAMQPPLCFGSVTGCRPIKSKIPTISCVSKRPPKWREFYFLHVPSSKPCNLAGKACSVTGCRPIKKLKNKFFYVSELPTKFVFIFFAWLVVFVKKVLALWRKVW